MTFSEILSERVKERPLVSFTLDLECVQSLLEEMCMKLDKFQVRIEKVEDAVAGKATYSEMRDFKEDVASKVALLTSQAQKNDEKVENMEVYCKDKIKKMEESMELQINNCLVESATKAKQIVEESTPEIVKKVIESMPNVDGLITQNEASQKAVNNMTENFNKLLEHIDKLSQQDQSLQAQIDELASQPMPLSESEQGEATPQPVSRGLSIERIPTPSISPGVELKMQDDINKLRDELAKLSREQSERLKEIDGNIEKAREFTSQQVNSARNDLGVADKNIESSIAQLKQQMQSIAKDTEKVSARGPEMPSDLLDRINAIESELSETKDKLTRTNDEMSDAKNSLGALKAAFEKPPAIQAAPVVVNKESGEVDLTPITNSLNLLDNQLKIMGSRVEVLEQRKQVSPDALARTREIATKCVERLNALENRVTQEIADVLTKQEREIFSLREELMNECRDIRDIATGAREVGAACTRNGEETMRILQKTRTEVADIQMKIAALSESSASDAKLDKITGALSSISQDLKSMKDEQKNNAAQFEELMKYHAQDKSEITSLWQKFNDLSKEWTEKAESFIPSKVELMNTKRQATIIVQRSEPRADDSARKSTALPRIQNRTIIDDSKLETTNAKVDKQENIIQSMRRQVEQLNKQVKDLDENKADKVAAQNLFEQFRIAMGELNNRINSLKRNLLGKADISEIHKLLQQAYESNDTAGAYEPVRCICCGRPRTGVTGALDEANNRKTPPQSTRAITDSDGQVCFVYGDHGDMYIGRSGDGRSRFTSKLSNDETVLTNTTRK